MDWKTILDIARKSAFRKIASFGKVDNAVLQVIIEVAKVVILENIYNDCESYHENSDKWCFTVMSRRLIEALLVKYPTYKDRFSVTIGINEQCFNYDYQLRENAAKYFFDYDPIFFMIHVKY